MNARITLGVVLCLILGGCDDSKTPLSDPQSSAADEQLTGQWLEEGGAECYYIGPAGPKFPKGMMRIISVSQSADKLEPPTEYLAYPTTVGDKTYLNVLIDEKQVRHFDDKGWDSDAVECYTFLKYRLDGDRLTVWVIDEKAKEEAIRSGKIKGTSEPDATARFTDTAENVACFVAQSDDSLWDTNEPGRFDRATTTKKQ